MTEGLVKQSIAELRDFARCRRYMVDAVQVVADRIEELEAKLVTKKTCPLGKDCDLTVAWMAGRESAKDEYKARIAPALEPRPDAGGALKRALEQAREEGRREEREACAKLAHDLQVSADQINDAYAAKRLPGVFLEPDGYEIAAAIRARAAELKGEK